MGTVQGKGTNQLQEFTVRVDINLFQKVARLLQENCRTYTIRFTQPCHALRDEEAPSVHLLLSSIIDAVAQSQQSG